MSINLGKTARVVRASEPAGVKSRPSRIHSANARMALDPSAADLAAAIAQARNQLRERIAQAAYSRAQARGFAPGHELEDWLAAEAEITGG